jgi:putative NADPH-quinone reductase
MKRILIIQAHPKSASYGQALAEAYMEGAIDTGATIETLTIRELSFNLNLTNGFKSDQEFEPDLVRAQQLIQWADHLVFEFPIWWGTMPALLKGFIDRVFLPGFAFQYRKKSVLVDGLLKNKTARLLVTMDSPWWYFRFFLRNAGITIMKTSILEFSGVKPVRTTLWTPIRKSTDGQRQQWLEQAKRLGRTQI